MVKNFKFQECVFEYHIVPLWSYTIISKDRKSFLLSTIHGYISETYNLSIVYGTVRLFLSYQSLNWNT